MFSPSDRQFFYGITIVILKRQRGRQGQVPTLKELLPEGQQRELSSTFGNVEVRVLELHWRADGTLCRAFARGLERARLRSTIKIKERCGSGSEHSEHGQHSEYNERSGYSDYSD